MFADPSRPVNAIDYNPSWRVASCASQAAHPQHLPQLAFFLLMSYACSPPEVMELLLIYEPWYYRSGRCFRF